MGKTFIDKRYQLRGLVGSGGMADVYLAHDQILDRDVALKLLKDRYAKNEEFVERFKRVARSAALLSHPHIVPIFDAGGTGDGTYYIAMEYLPGGTLKDRIMSKGTLPARTATAVALQIAGALRVAHERGVIHRDIKPHNILITDSGHVKVGDFGIAHAAEVTTISNLGDILGSAKYTSPEQAMDERVGPASDLYSFGVVLYEMLTARAPFEIETPADVSVKHVAGGLPPHPREINPEVPEGMDALVMKLLSRDPAERHASAGELIEDLRRVWDALPPHPSSADEATTAALAAPALPTPGGTEPRRGRKWFLIAAAFTLFALLSAVGAVVGWSVLQNFNDGTVFVTAGLLFAFALLLWAFAVLLWDLLEGRMRAWIRVVLVALLAPACALTTALISAVAALALVTVLESDRPTVGPSKPPAHTAPTGAETTSKETSSQTAADRMASASAAPTSSASASPSATPSATASSSASASAAPSATASPSP